MTKFLLESLSTIILISFISLAGCTKSSGGGGGDDSSSSDPESDVLGRSCGVVIDDSLKPEVDRDKAELVTVRAMNSDIVAINRVDDGDDEGLQLVLLQGLTSEGVNDFLAEEGEDYINDLVRDGALFVSAGRDCNIVVNSSARGTVGQLFGLDGTNINEKLIQMGAAIPDPGPCGGDQLTSCYRSLDVDENFSPYVITDFLWKPESERDGKLVVLFSYGGRSDPTIEVDGAISTTLLNSGPSNGRDVTARSGNSGCSFGDNVRVTVFDANGLQVRFNLGGVESASLTIPRGCDRYER